MSKVFLDAKDKNVAVTVLYADDTTKHLSLDKEKKKKLSKEELLDLFFKGTVVTHEDKYYTPVLFKTEGTAGGLVITDGSTEQIFYSQEHAN